MKHSTIPSLGLAVLAGASLVTPAWSTFSMDYVTVGNPGNAADTRFGTGSLGHGSVDHVYNIGKYEVTNAQYVEFLNAVDPVGANANGIYNASMGTNARGGITYTSGSASGSKYTIRTNMGDKPVNYVSWYDAARFSNWMATGNTETGSYTLNGNTGFMTKNAGAMVYLPSEDEWYKAAYFDSTNFSYSLYPTQSNTAPTIATADALGNISNSGANVANYSGGAAWNSLNGNVTTVGSAGADSASFYGTFDQGGNVYEWNDAVISSYRGVLGGAFNSFDYNMASTNFNDYVPSAELSSLGFRVASSFSAIPEPTSMLPTLALVSSGLLLRRRTKGLR